MQEEQIRKALNMHWQASATGDANAEHDTMTTPFVIIRSQVNESSVEETCRPCGVIIQAGRRAYQGRPAYTVSIMEFRNGKVVHETQYFADPFEAPAWRSQWVQRIAGIDSGIATT